MKSEFRTAGKDLAAHNARNDARRKANEERIKRLRAGYGGALVERVEVEGEELFIKRLAWPEITRVRLAMPRDANKILDLRDRDSLMAISAALAVSCVVMKPEGWGEDGFDVSTLKAADLVLQFDADEAVTLTNIEGSAAMKFNMELFAHCTRVNPDVIPTSGGSSTKQ